MHSNNFEANKEYWRNNFAKKGIVFTFLDTSAEMEYYFKLNLWQVREGVQNTCVGGPQINCQRPTRKPSNFWTRYFPRNVPVRVHLAFFSKSVFLAHWKKVQRGRNFIPLFSVKVCFLCVRDQVQCKILLYLCHFVSQFQTCLKFPEKSEWFATW